MASKSEQMLADANLEPAPVEPKLLVPLAQAASLETEPSLIENWAALMANASGPKAGSIGVNYVDILRQMGTLDVRILDLLTKEIESLRVGYSQGTTTYISIGDIRRRLADGYIHPKYASITEPEWEPSIDNLLRLRLCVIRKKSMDANSHWSVAEYDKMENQEIAMTRLGWYFYGACQPPRAASQPIQATA